MRGRVLLGAAGVAVSAYGGFRLLELGWANLLQAVAWLAGGVLAHDAVLAPATVAVCAVAARLLPPHWRGPAAGGLLVLGTLTVVSVPVLGRFGARPDDPTLLDRDYLLGWLGVAGAVTVGVVAARVVAAGVGRRGGRSPLRGRVAAGSNTRSG